MGFFSDGVTAVQTAIDEAYKKNINAIEGSTAGATREMKANADVAASRGGYLGTGLYDTVLNKNTQIIRDAKNQKLLEAGAQHEANTAANAANMVNAKMQDQTAQNALYGNLATGGGALLGSLINAFAPGVGTVVQSALPAATSALTNNSNALNLGNLASSFKIPSTSLTNF